jgi:hypothetical protein
MKTTVSFPSYVKDESGTTLIKKLLNKNIQERGIGGF